MAVDLTPYELPVAPSDRTGLYDLPDEQAAAILEYAAALWIAKRAGVAGKAIDDDQIFIDAVVRKRVLAAREGGAAWEAMYHTMQRDIDAWQVRIGDRAVRALRQRSGPSTQARANAVMTVVHGAAGLGEDQLEQLEHAFEASTVRDVALAEQALPGIAKPHLGSLRHRALRLFDEHPDAAKVRTVVADLPRGAWHAAVGAFLGDGIAAPYRAILCGPWDEVVHGIPTTLHHAWTGEAQALRENFLDLPREAHEMDDPFPF